MASPQLYYATQSKGTLVPGQTITVNKYTVQVERYLSQGGFAHVYLVRTPVPVFNTTHHVLKRIAVANEATLTEVKKEVDIMRLLKGHPNIVYLIDAAWHKMSNGTYEVFILMEFCPGGGIIDMMNRRLRERLNEAEILQIFVDVCEGVACMHNLRPALLHRDLKVENILQSSPTSFKLCDFGSATTVTRPPTTTVEIRALEADLNKHTTLQYRAPEMIDVYQRRPVDEKSDVWALGVLLYKLCYYTTPFEEHGPLAILNVQYRIPSYPVYSPQMNELIASMLQEHGMRRPTIFQLLDHVHRLRGTKSRFKYTISVPQPLSPYPSTPVKPSSKSIVSERPTVAPKTLPMTITHSKARQAQQQVMNAIAPIINGETSTSNTGQTYESTAPKYLEQQLPPMRRGRPAITRSLSTSKDELSQTSVPSTSNTDAKNWLDSGFVAEEDRAWKALASSDSSFNDGSNTADPWKQDGRKTANKDTSAPKGFGDNFSNKPLEIATKPTVTTKRASPSLFTRQRPLEKRDAFEGLGLAIPAGRPAPTLGEARMLRTGLAVMNSSGFRKSNEGVMVKTSPQIPPSPFKSPSPAVPSYDRMSSSSFTTGSGSSLSTKRLSPSKNMGDSLQPSSSMETRFPSLEELDAKFSMIKPLAFPLSSRSSNDSSSSFRQDGSILRSSSHISRPDVLHSRGGTESEQTMGRTTEHANASARKRDEEALSIKPLGFSPSSTSQNDLLPSILRSGAFIPRPEKVDVQVGTGVEQVVEGTDTKVRRRDEDAFSSKPVVFSPSTTSQNDLSSPLRQDGSLLRGEEEVIRKRDEDSFFHGERARRERSSWMGKPKSEERSANGSGSRLQAVDWLTGDGGGANFLEQPILRESPSKRASLIVSQGEVAAVQSAVIGKPEEIAPAALGGAKSQGQSQEIESASSADEGPEDAGGSQFGRRRTVGKKGRQSSVHDLVDLYGGGIGVRSGETSGLSTPQPSTRVYGSKSPSGGTGLVPPLTLNGDGRGMMMVTTSSPTRRARPESMIVFPTSKSDGGGVSPAELSVPEGMLHSRRMSITDMVQRYEGISKVVQRPPGPRLKVEKEGGEGGGLRRKTSGNSIGGGEEKSPVRGGGMSRSGEGDGGSAGSEIPFQGVGRLIEQWQRKSAEAESGRTSVVNKQGGASGKRRS